MFGWQAYGQKLKTDTIYPYKIIGDQDERTLLSGNTTVPFNFTSGTIRLVLEKAIHNNDKVALTYDPVTLSIKKVKSVRLNDRQSFYFKHERLSLGNFNFNQLKPFSKNEIDFTKELRAAQPPLIQVIPHDQVDSIFKYFQSLSCTNVNSCDAKNPCITYDYKIDGCYARAHMMRKILAEKYHFDCQKIFVEGHLRAINSGSCSGKCVKWGWHVAVYVQTLDSVGNPIGLVIDPSLFDKACTIAEWANAQGMTCCATCQPGIPGIPYIKASYTYTPNGSTDDDYSKTMDTLYSYCKECH
jgi:hypothetical protein